MKVRGELRETRKSSKGKKEAVRGRCVFLCVCVCVFLGFFFIGGVEVLEGVTLFRHLKDLRMKRGCCRSDTSETFFLFM